jgi:uncharacterized protein (DUF302 family)
MKSLVIAAILVSGLIFSMPGELVWSQEKDMTSTNDLAYVAELPCGFDDAIEQVTTALKAEQFGIISRIDLHTTFKEKLGVDMKPHTILGACNPKLAHQAVTARPEASLMLPCNVTVQYVDDQKTIVRIGNPHTFMAISGLDQDKVIRSVGDQANERLQRVAQSLSDGK